MDVAHIVAADQASTVESGQPVVCHGDAALGPLSIECDGTIAGQIWGAGAALGRHRSTRSELRCGEGSKGATDTKNCTQTQKAIAPRCAPLNPRRACHASSARVCLALFPTALGGAKSA